MSPKQLELKRSWRTAIPVLVVGAFAAANACSTAERLKPIDDTTYYDAGPTPTATTTSPMPTTTTTSPMPTTTSTSMPPDAGSTCPGPKCEVWSDPMPFVDPTLFPKCADPAIPECADGYCVPKSAIPADVGDAVNLLQPCDDVNVCIPEEFIRTGGKFIVPTCQSINGAEGRCLSLCIPQVASQASFLPQDICKDSERCAPCYDPRTGESTGACDQGCDGGACEPAVTFDKCCGGIGSCVPSSLVPPQDQSLLGTDTCTGTEELCAPDVLASSTYIPPTCRSIADAEGRCLASCIPQIAAQADRLPQADCAAGELCAPCFDPVTGTSTGACERNGDTPAETPFTFDECCGTEGSCVPLDILTDEQKTQLGHDSCTDGYLCAPKVFAAPGMTATPCDSINGAEGRCLPTCVPLVADQADRLPQDICPAGNLCAPCYDPISGAATGACTQNGDAPTESPYAFPVCCGGIGVCVPTSLVPAEQQSLLGTDTCTGTNVLCAPKALTDPGARPATCYSFEPQHREGRCLAACIPQVQQLSAQLRQETCASGELCAPCYDPRTGDSTGACEINGDTPQDANLGPFVTCPAINTFCALLPVCTPCDGRCVPAYIVPSDQAGLLVQGQCQTSELCAPCYNPLDGTSTGACGPDGQMCPPP